MGANGDISSMVEVKSPFPECAIPRLWVWMQTFRSRVCDDFSPRTLEEFVEYFQAEMQVQKTWGVYRDGELVGMVSFQAFERGLGTAHCVFKRDAWSKSTTIPALQAAVAEMFAGETRRLTLSVLEGNNTMGDLIVQLGGRREGTLRKQTFRDGRPIDVMVYGLLKEEFISGEVAA